MEKSPELGDSLGILCIRKLLNDIIIRSKPKANSDYKTNDKQVLSLQSSTGQTFETIKKHLMPVENRPIIKKYIQRQFIYGRQPICIHKDI